jgi:hypothetical protein
MTNQPGRIALPIAVRRRLFLAAGLTVVALCLPWSPARAGSYLHGWYAPGSCISVYDSDGYATLDCTPGYVTPGWFTPGTAMQPGYATDLRIIVLVAVAALLVGLRRSSPALQQGALLVAVAGLALNLAPQSGQLVYAVAVALAAIALRQLWSAASTSPATSRIRSSSSAP